VHCGHKGTVSPQPPGQTASARDAQAFNNMLIAKQKGKPVFDLSAGGSASNNAASFGNALALSAMGFTPRSPEPSIVAERVE
jgi:hypothetical protein